MLNRLNIKKRQHFNTKMTIRKTKLPPKNIQKKNSYTMGCWGVPEKVFWAEKASKMLNRFVLLMYFIVDCIIILLVMPLKQSLPYNAILVT